MFEFQLCAKADQFPVGDGWIVEEKHNGVRLAVEYTLDGVTGWCRGVFEVALPNHIAEALPDLPVGTVLDGEYIFGEDEHSAMGALARRMVPPVGQYAAFDILWPLERGSLNGRKMRLFDLFPACEGCVVFAVAWHRGNDQSPKESLDAVISNGGEGIVCKRLDSLYSPGRHHTWQKFKTQPK